MELLFQLKSLPSRRAGSAGLRERRPSGSCETAKLLLRGDKPKQAFGRGNTLTLFGTVVGIVLVVNPVRTRGETVFWLFVMFAALIYPLLHLARTILHDKLKSLQALASIGLPAILVIAIGHHIWPPIHRHALNDRERALFEKPLSEQKEPREEIEILCAQGNEPVCVYAAQFVNFFREAGWKVRDNHVQPVTLSNPTAGIVLFKHGQETLDPDKWQSGLWTALTASCALREVRRPYR